jgi:hypothetical protein
MNIFLDKCGFLFLYSRMKEFYDKAQIFIERQKLELAAKNLQHFLRIQKEQVTLDAICDNLIQRLIDAQSNNPSDFCEMLATQVHILDATFHFYLEEAKVKDYTRYEQVAFALKAQQHALRTALGWKKLKTETYLKRVLVPVTKNTDPDPRSHAPLDR